MRFPALSEFLQTLFIASRRCVASGLKAAGVPGCAQVQRPIVTDRITSEAVVQNVLGLEIDLPDGPWLNADGQAAARQCAADLVVAAGDRLPFFTYWPKLRRFRLVDQSQSDQLDGDYEQDATEWTLRSLVLPALQAHLEALECVDAEHHPAPDAPAVYARAVLDVALADRLDYVMTMNVGGFDLTQPSMSTGPFTVCRLEPAERGQIFADAPRMYLTELAGLPDTVVSLRVTGPRRAQYKLSSTRSERFVLAAQLHGHPLFGEFAYVRADPWWVDRATFQTPLALPRQLPFDQRKRTRLTEDGLADIVATVERLVDDSLVAPNSAQEMALHRFGFGMARSSAMDALVDFTIALEGLLLRGESGSNGYRFRRNGAHYLASRRDDRRTVERQLKRIYTTRSQLVHGNRRPSWEAVNEVRDLARDFARRGLMRALLEGFPAAEHFPSAPSGPPAN